MEDGRSELVIKYLQGQLDTQDINDFYTWVNENVENKKVFFEIKAVYDACYTNRMQNDMEGSWDRLLKKRKVFYPRKKSRWLQLGNYAAVSFITVCLTSLFLTFNKDEDKIATRYIGGDGLDADVVELPDGTQVCLGSKTVFHYENDYGRKERIVYLEGEAYFEVAKDKDKPFIVKTKEQNIEALGTKFNVTAYASDSLLTTTLLEGAVRLKTENILHQTILKPNQQFIYNRNTHAGDVRNVDAKQFTSWTTGYYYLIPVGEGGMAAVFIRKDDLDAMDILTDETYNYLSGGDVPQTEVHFEGVAVKMDKELAGLEGAFRDQLEYMGYTESEVNEMLTSYSDGECLVLSGPAEMSTMYVMTAIVFAVLLLAILLIVRNYRREAEYDKQ